MVLERRGLEIPGSVRVIMTVHLPPVHMGNVTARFPDNGQ
jgi:hypothetical protein